MVSKILDVERRMQSADYDVTKPEWKECGAARNELQAFAKDGAYGFQPVAAAHLAELKKMEIRVGIERRMG